MAEGSIMKDLGSLLNMAVTFDNLAFGDRNMAVRSDNMALLTINLALPNDYLAFDDILRLLPWQKQTIKQIKKHFISTEMFFNHYLISPICFDIFTSFCFSTNM